MEIGIHKIKENLKLTKEHWAGLGLRHWGGVLQAFGFGALAGDLFLSFGTEADFRVYEVIFLVICTVLIVVGQFIGAASDWRKSLLTLPGDAMKISVFSTKDCRIRRGLLVEADAEDETVVFDADGKQRGPSDCVVVTDDAAATQVAQHGGYGVMASYAPELLKAWEAWLLDAPTSRDEGVAMQEEKWNLFRELVCDAVATLDERRQDRGMNSQSATDTSLPS